MSNLVTIPSAAHWYSKDGKPFHTVIGANGKERDTTLRDARKLFLLPSVTSVLSVIAKPALTAWISEQAILAALTLPRDKDEQDQAFAARVVKDMDAQRDNAADVGKQVHNAVDQVLTGQLPDPAMSVYVKPIEDWLTKMDIEPVKVEADVVSGEFGFGGRIDLYAKSKTPSVRRVLVDFKTQKAKAGKFNFYETWGLQLAAYGQALFENGCPVDEHYSLAIDTGGAGIVEAKLWTSEELNFEAFAAALTLWKFIRGYDPLQSA